MIADLNAALSLTSCPYPELHTCWDFLPLPGDDERLRRQESLGGQDMRGARYSGLGKPGRPNEGRVITTAQDIGSPSANRPPQIRSRSNASPKGTLYSTVPSWTGHPEAECKMGGIKHSHR
jgi:hypothetical protein